MFVIDFPFEPLTHFDDLLKMWLIASLGIGVLIAIAIRIHHHDE